MQTSSGHRREKPGVYIIKLYADYWKGSVDYGSELNQPNLEQVSAAIRALDGRQRTLVTLEAGAGAFMGISGGGDNYVITATYDNQEFFDLTRHDVPSIDDDDQDSADDSVEIIAGGQIMDVPARQCVGLDIALRMAQTFADEGTLDPSATWEKR